MHAWFTGLWRHPDFLKLWAAQTISLLGSAFTSLAFPLTAAIIFDASAAQMGLLAAVGNAPWLLFGLFIGAWVDRTRRRPILVWANLSRALLLGSIPLTATLGLLRLEHLYAIAFLLGIATVTFDVAYQSYLPSLVARAQLMEGNGKLNTSLSMANIAGPSLAGVVIQVLTAPLAIVIDALSFLLSALLLGAIRQPESRVRAATRGAGWREIGAGLRLIRADPYIRAFQATNGTFFFFHGVITAILILYLTRELDLAPAIIGLVFGAGSVGGLLGTLVAGTLATRWGIGSTIVWSAVLRGASFLGLPLAGTLTLGIVPMLIATQFLGNASWSIYFVTQTSTRQALVPDHLQGRAAASFWVIIRGAILLGALLGGALGTAFGLQVALMIGALGALLSGFWVVRSPVGALHEQPAPSEDRLPA